MMQIINAITNDPGQQSETQSAVHATSFKSKNLGTKKISALRRITHPAFSRILSQLTSTTSIFIVAKEAS